MNPFHRKPKHHNIIGFQTAWTLAVAITLIRACSRTLKEQVCPST